MKRIIYTLFALVIVVSTGCKKDFFDINENPNNPTEDAMTPELLLPSVLHQSAKKMATSYDYAAHWMGYWARSGTFGPSNPLENYDLTTSYERDEWVNGSTASTNPTVSWYNILMDADIMEKKAQESGQGIYEGIAKVMKSVGFMYLVDQYNNVPYTEAFKGTEFINPKYDKGQDIYNDLIAQLNEAKRLFAEGDVLNNEGIEAADVMFGGNTTMWRKLANTQHLKLLLRQSELFGSTPPRAELDKIEADGSGFLMSGETAEVDLNYAVELYHQNPFWDTYLRDYNGILIDNFNRANNYLLREKFKYGEAEEDIRLKYVFSPAQTPIGDNTYLGYDFGFVDTDPNNPKAVNSSNVAGPGLAKSASQPQWFFTSVESMFLQAEAVQRGWIDGDVELAYEAAVTESFVWLEVEDAEDEAARYLEFRQAVWNGSLERIINQKYMALAGINNFEAWVDYRRLGFPSDVPVSLSPSRNGRNIPVRLLYPQEEYSYNGANVGAEGTINAQTSKVFWDK